MSILLTLILTVALTIAGLILFAAITARKVEATAPPCGQFVEIDGQRLHYVGTGGTGPGRRVDPWPWGEAVALYVCAGGQAVGRIPGSSGGSSRLRLFDTPGRGVQADTLAKFMRKLELKNPLLVGHSLGGALSLAIALDHPDCAGAVALIAPLTQAQGGVPEPFQGLVIKSPVMRKIIAWTLAIPMSIQNAPKMLKVVFGPDSVPADFPTRGGGVLGLRPNAFYNTSSDVVSVIEDLPGMMSRYSGLSVPLGMLFGKGDLILDYRIHGEVMKEQCPALDLVLVDGRGHMLPLTEPDATAALIRHVAARQSEPRATIG